VGERRALLSGAAFEDALAALLYDERARERLRVGQADDHRFLTLDIAEVDEAARGVRRMVAERTHRGTGGLEDWFPRTVAAWRLAHPDDEGLDGLLRLFCASAHCSAWREAGSGISLEEAFYRLLSDLGVGDRETVEDEFLGAIVRTLAISPRARFARPSALRDARRGCYAVSNRGVLHASLDGKYVHGALTPLVVDLLSGVAPDDVARRHAVRPEQLADVVEALRVKGLLC
jgi:hypothetical protein